MNSDLSHIILGQRVTEKGTKLSALNKYLFKVQLLADKRVIKKAIEVAFNVKVASINTVKVGGKERRFGQTVGRRSDWKKAYVTLMDGYSINIPETESVKD